MVGTGPQCSSVPHLREKELQLPAQQEPCLTLRLLEQLVGDRGSALFAVTACPSTRKGHQALQRAAALGWG